MRANIPSAPAMVWRIAESEAFLECGGRAQRPDESGFRPRETPVDKREPSPARKRRRRCALPAQSITPGVLEGAKCLERRSLSR